MNDQPGIPCYMERELRCQRESKLHAVRGWAYDLGFGVDRLVAIAYHRNTAGFKLFFRHTCTCRLVYYVQAFERVYATLNCKGSIHTMTNHLFPRRIDIIGNGIGPGKNPRLQGISSDFLLLGMLNVFTGLS